MPNLIMGQHGSQYGSVSKYVEFSFPISTLTILGQPNSLHY